VVTDDQLSGGWEAIWRWVEERWRMGRNNATCSLEKHVCEGKREIAARRVESFKRFCLFSEARVN